MSTDNINNINIEAESEMYEEDLNEQRKIRRQKLRDLQEADRNPYIYETWNVTAHSKDIKENFDALEDEEVSCAGRIMSKRIMGKASFCNLSDRYGSMQCYVARDSIGEDL